MKKIFLFIIIPIITFAQEDLLHTGECIITLINYGTSWNVTFTATVVTERWDENYYLTADYETATDIVQSPVYIAYFDLIYPTASINPIMALGKYKISAIEGGVEQAYFYMDWRTSDYGACPDVYFNYDVASNHFRNYENTQTIDGTTQTVWDLVDEIDFVTTGLELYSTLSNYDNHPKISWNAFHDSNSVSSYRIYRKYGSAPFELRTSVSNNTFYYVDNSVSISQQLGGTSVQYYVAAYLGTSESLPGNIISVNVKGGEILKENNLKGNSIQYLSYDLFQNYPNPFNPSTMINYQLRESDFVNLKVYNAIGETVAELVNQEQEEGSYSIEFNALNLPSGIYLYKIQTNKFTDVKKMILLR